MLTQQQKQEISLKRLPAKECKKWFTELFEMFFVEDSQNLSSDDRSESWRFFLTMSEDLDKKIKEEVMFDTELTKQQ